ncbi:bacteriocin [Aquimarina litoralis]|uniref:bacteriocin n=1 Tax=Aquimarina litoralis TaxID=584605 RepID=UPI0031D8A2EA
MKESLANLGKTLSKNELKQINGKGNIYYCSGGNAHTTNQWCPVRCFMGNCLL